MIPKRLVLFFFGSAMLFMLAASPNQQSTLTHYLPELKGWQADGPVQTYDSENLFQYINGAAELYLSYDFLQVATVNLENKAKHSLTIDIYQHSSDRNAFGIYSQEKPRQGEFLSIGNQGYYEEGLVNFVKGPFYVKLICFGLEKDKKEFLLATARRIAEKLPASSSLPAPLALFPVPHKVAFSERYIAQNFLGYKFLHSAFVADYKFQDQESQLFIIEASDAAAAQEMVEQYQQFTTKKESPLEKKAGFVRFQDPYHRHHGAVNVRWQGRYVWGMFSDDQKVYLSLLDAVQGKLPPGNPKSETRNRDE